MRAAMACAACSCARLNCRATACIASPFCARSIISNSGSMAGSPDQVIGHYIRKTFGGNTFLRLALVLAFLEGGLDRAVPASIVERQHVVGHGGLLGQHFLER